MAPSVRGALDVRGIVGGGGAMAKVKDWGAFRAQCERLLRERTGEGVAAWNARTRGAKVADEADLRRWLGSRGVTGYAQSLLVMERFGYPDWFTASAGELIAAQYDGRPELREVYDAVVR